MPTPNPYYYYTQQPQYVPYYHPGPQQQGQQEPLNAQLGQQNYKQNLNGNVNGNVEIKRTVDNNNNISMDNNNNKHLQQHLATPEQAQQIAQQQQLQQQQQVAATVNSSMKFRRGPWAPSEDKRLLELVSMFGGEKNLNWVKISQLLETRTAKQARERYHQNLKPSLNRSPITQEEGELIEELVEKHGKRWAEIARHLNGRSDNAIKNWWNGGANRRKRASISSGSSKSLKNQKEMEDDDESGEGGEFDKTGNDITNADMDQDQSDSDNNNDNNKEKIKNNKEKVDSFQGQNKSTYQQHQVEDIHNSSDSAYRRHSLYDLNHGHMNSYHQILLPPSSQQPLSSSSSSSSQVGNTTVPQYGFNYSPMHNQNAMMPPPPPSVPLHLQLQQQSAYQQQGLPPPATAPLQMSKDAKRVREAMPDPLPKRRHSAAGIPANSALSPRQYPFNVPSLPSINSRQSSIGSVDLSSLSGSISNPGSMTGSRRGSIWANQNAGLRRGSLGYVPLSVGNTGSRLSITSLNQYSISNGGAIDGFNKTRHSSIGANFALKPPSAAPQPNADVNSNSNHELKKDIFKKEFSFETSNIKPKINLDTDASTSKSNYEDNPDEAEIIEKEKMSISSLVS